MKSGAKIGGVFTVRCWRPNGSLRWEESAHNLVTNEGLDHLLDVLFHGSTQVSPWYVGLKGPGAAAADDTLASHAGWAEIADYAGNRQEYVEAAAASQVTSNAANPARFAMNADYTVAGLFLASAATGTSGVLLAVADFAAVRTGHAGDIVDVTYTVSAADAG